MKVLLADDDLVIRRLLQRTLERSGFEVVCAGNGQSAAEALVDPNGPRIAVLDWMMPGIDGPDVCRYVRSQPGNPQRYLILLTSREKREDVLMGLEAGADDYLIKPCAREEVKARVRAGQRILELQDRMAHESLHDSVTQLPNRAFFTRRLTENAQRAKENSDYQFTVLLVGVDRFKTVNDSLGYPTGDELLKSTARRLLQLVRTGYPDTDPLRTGEGFADVVTRFYGDEFAILLENSRGTSDGIRVAQRIQRLFEPALSVDGHEVFLTVSIGIAASDSKWVESKDILRSADLAMHKAKELGRSRFEISNTEESIALGLDPFEVEHDIRRAIQNSEFEVYYQPIVRLDNYRIHGFEALARWRHPKLGLLAPAEFLGVAEETGLICPIGQTLMRTACEQMVEWNARFASPDPATVSVNISPKQFDPVTLVELVSQVIRESGINPCNLELEVTENLTMEHADRAIVVLRKLSELGISLGLDDFGSGYSSLNYLQRFPLATLKIDRAFILDIETSQKSCAIAKTVIALGHGLGMRVVAEGIETPGQMEILSKFGCDLGQGFLFSRPIPADTMAQLMVERRQGFMLNPYNTSEAGPVVPGPRSVAIWSGPPGIREDREPRYGSVSSHCSRRLARKPRRCARIA